MDDKILGDLYNALASELLDRIRSGEANAAELNVARGFLKDNGIDATPSQSEPLSDLVNSLPFRTKLESA